VFKNGIIPTTSSSFKQPPHFPTMTVKHLWNIFWLLFFLFKKDLKKYRKTWSNHIPKGDKVSALRGNAY